MLNLNRECLIYADFYQLFTNTKSKVFIKNTLYVNVYL